MVSQRPKFLTFPVIAAFIAATAALAAVGSMAVMDHRADAESQITSELASIVDLKLEQVSSWRRERISDASFVANNPQIHRNALLLAAGNAPPLARKEMFGWMASMFRNGQYGRIVAFDRAGRVLMSVPDSSAGPTPFASTLIATCRLRSVRSCSPILWQTTAMRLCSMWSSRSSLNPGPALPWSRL